MDNIMNRMKDFDEDRIFDDCHECDCQWKCQFVTNSLILANDNGKRSFGVNPIAIVFGYDAMLELYQIYFEYLKQNEPLFDDSNLDWVDKFMKDVNKDDSDN